MKHNLCETYILHVLASQLYDTFLYLIQIRLNNSFSSNNCGHYQSFCVKYRNNSKNVMNTEVMKAEGNDNTNSESIYFLLFCNNVSRRNRFFFICIQILQDR